MRLALLAPLAALVVACTNDEEPPPDLLAPVAIHDGTWNYDDALISGTLVEEDGCLVLRAGNERVLPAFADDRVIWDPPSHVLTVRGVQFRPGEQASFGGSGRDGHELPPGLHWVNAPPDTCRYDSIWFVSPPSSTASPAPGPQGSGGAAARYAREYGVTLQEAERRLSLQLSSGETAAKLQATQPDRLAGVWLEHTPEFRLVAWYTAADDGLEQARAIAATAPLPVEIRTGARRSEAELRGIQERILPRARELFYLTGLEVDVKSNGLRLFIENRPPNAARATELAAQLTREFGVPITIEVDK